MYIPYLTAQEAQDRIDSINAQCLPPSERWVGTGTDNYANVLAWGDGKFYVQLLNGYEEFFTEEELASQIESLPDVIEE